MLIGSGFEAQPELLRWIAQKLPLVGNLPEVVAGINNPRSFFAALSKLEIAHPVTYFELPSDTTGILRKMAGGSGGTHIRFVQPAHQSVDDLSDAENAIYYYQQHLSGQAVSILFLAHECGVELIGFNEQWQNPASDTPFRYGGAVSNICLPVAVEQQLQHAACKLSAEFGLRGLNSLDAMIVDDAGEPRAMVLEVNPRLSATVELYSADQPQLLYWHIAACTNRPLSFENRQANSQRAMNASSAAHAILYADQDVIIGYDMEWPEWVRDNPPSAKLPVRYLRGQPVCTVTAQAETAEEVKNIINKRVAFISALVNKKIVLIKGE